MSERFICYQCSKSLSPGVGNTIQFRETCQHCGCDAHVCRNCDLYDEGAHHECREPSAEWVRDKEKANRCDYFVLSGRGSAQASVKTDTLAALDALFKK